jgi:hypothetical protein
MMEWHWQQKNELIGEPKRPLRRAEDRPPEPRHGPLKMF